MPDELNVKGRIEDIRKLYAERSVNTNFSALVMGEPGMGKTSLICTGRKPILIDSFDPLGTTVIDVNFKKEIEAGEILVRTYWKESYKKPEMYDKWEREWEQDIRSGFLSNFGTYAIDSLSTFIDALTYRVSKSQGRSKGVLAIQDYIPVYNTIKDIIKLTASQNCDFILTGHLEPEKNELTGEVKCELSVYSKLKVSIPLLFTEKYVMLAKPTSQGVERVILTEPTHRYRASTQLGSGGRFKREEEPDIKKLLAKAGLNNNDKTL